MITTLFWLAKQLLWLYWWAVILAAVFSTLASFGILDTRNRVVWSIGDFLFSITEPALRPIRNLLPNLGGVDISPIILILLLLFISRLLHEYAVPATYVYVTVKVQPKSRRPGIQGLLISAHGPRLRIGAAAEGEQATRAACTVLAVALDLPASAVARMLGETSDKTLRVARDAAPLTQRLALL